MNLIFHDLIGIILEVYIDDIVIKSADLSHHLADLRLALERMRQYGLKMNPLKCAFGVSAGKFLSFIIHEKSIEIDPRRIEAMKKVEEAGGKIIGASKGMEPDDIPGVGLYMAIEDSEGNRVSLLQPHPGMK